MRGWARLAAPMLALLVGCGSDTDPAAQVPSRLGGPPPIPSVPPAEPMDGLEQPVADSLAPRLRDDGLTLTHVACPPWNGTVPFTTTCQGYVDGVVGTVEVELSDGPGGRVDFDAWLSEGVVATRRLVDRLEQDGFTGVDCGRTPAYPARVGLRLVCRVHDGEGRGYVVATVTDRAGAVEVEDH